MFQRPETKDPAMNIALRLGVALAFTLTGLDKFPANAYWIHVFDAIGMGQWLRYATGIIEVLGGLLFLIPAATSLGALLLAGTMLGAMAVHVVVFRRPADSLFPAIYLAGVVIAFMKLRGSRQPAASTRNGRPKRPPAKAIGSSISSRTSPRQPAKR